MSAGGPVIGNQVSARNHWAAARRTSCHKFWSCLMNGASLRTASRHFLHVPLLKREAKQARQKKASLRLSSWVVGSLDDLLASG